MTSPIRNKQGFGANPTPTQKRDREEISGKRFPVPPYTRGSRRPQIQLIRNALLAPIRLLFEFCARIRTSPVGHRLAHSAFWSLAGAVISRLSTLIALTLAARVLGKEGFGQLGVIQSTIGMLAVFSGLSIGLTATKHVAEFRQIDPFRAGQVVALTRALSALSGTLVAVLLYLFADLLAMAVLGAAELSSPLRLAACLVFLGAVTGVQTGILTGLESFKAIATVNLVTGILCIPLVVGGAWAGGIAGTIIGLTVTQAIGWLVGRMALRSRLTDARITPSYTDCLLVWPAVWRFSVPAILSNIMLAPVYWIGVAMLISLPGGQAEMGLFNAASQWKAIVIFLPGTLSSVILPMLSNLHGQNDHVRYSKLLLYNVLLTCSFAVFGAFCVAIGANVIMSSYGSGFSEGSSTLIMLVMSGVLVATTGAIGQGIASRGEMWWGFSLNVCWAASFIASATLLVRYGAIGLALADLISYAVHAVTVSLFVYFRLIRSPTGVQRLKSNVGK